MPHPRGRTRAVSARRENTWIGPALQGSVAVAAAGASLIFSFDPFANGMPKPTVVRTRGVLTITPQAFTADLTIHGAFGLGIVSDQAFAAGVVSMPEPFSDANWDGWFVWQSFALTLEFITASGTIQPANLQIEIDSKAMRKVSDNETVVAICESQAGAFNCGAHLRQLYKLS